MAKTGKICFIKIVWVSFIMTLALLPSIVFGFDIIAQVDKTRISKQDSIFLRVIVGNGKADLDISGITDFKVYPRGTSSSYQYINGKSERKTTYEFVLVPLSVGQLTIPAIPAHMDDQVKSSQPIAIQVAENVVDPNDVKELFAKAQVSSPKLFVGQQAVYTIKFYTSKRLAGLGFENRPEFKGLTTKPFESEKKYSLNIDGKNFNVIQLDFLIIPSTPGIVTIDPVSFIAKERIQSNRAPSFDSMFNDSFFSSNQYKPVRVVSNPVTIDVASLPVYNGEGNYSGLVGQFEIQAALDQSSLVVGESATCTIAVSGIGNIMDASLPQMNLDDLGFKVYDDNPVDAIGLTENGYQGSRTFKKALVPVSPGQYRIEPLGLIYFDVTKKRYETVFTQAIQLDVKAGEALLPDPGQLSPVAKKQIEKKEVSILNKDILDVKTGLFVLKDDQPMGRYPFLLFLMLPALLFALLKFVYVFKAKDRSSDKIMLEKAKHHLKLADKTQMGDESFLSHLYAALTAGILSKKGKIGESVTTKETRTILEASNVDEETISTISNLMNTIESVRFGGRKIDEHSARQLLSTTKKVIKHLGCLLTCMLLLALTPQKGLADVTDDYTTAMNHYKTARFLEAAQSFEQVAKTPIRNPYLYFNIGNAYLKANDVGRAILWYERSKMLAPNDPDLLFNLNHAHTLVQDKHEIIVDYMELLFFWDKLIGVKAIQYAAIGLSFFFFTWAAFRTMNRKPIFSGKGILLFALLMISISLVGINYYKLNYVQTAVVVAPKIEVRSGTSESATPLFSLHAGSLVKVKEKRDSALKIQFSKDRVGWVHSDQVIVVQDL